MNPSKFRRWPHLRTHRVLTGPWSPPPKRAVTTVTSMCSLLLTLGGLVLFRVILHRSRIWKPETRTNNQEKTASGSVLQCAEVRAQKKRSLPHTQPEGLTYCRRSPRTPLCFYFSGNTLCQQVNTPNCCLLCCVLWMPPRRRKAEAHGGKMGPAVLPTAKRRKERSSTFTESR